MDKFSIEKNIALKEIIDARDYYNMVPPDKYPIPGEYVITGLQVGNHNGEEGWDKYVGYVVQVRKKAGVFGSNIVLIRHSIGNLISHENQSFFRMNKHWKEKIQALYEKGINPESEDYTQAYTIGEEYPEIGKVIEPKKDGYHGKNSGSVTTLTISHVDGSKTIETIV